jgi:YggT family protein
MPTDVDIVALMFNTVISVATLLLFLRFMMQLAALDPYNPVVLSTIRATHIADVFSRIIPSVGQGRVNLAALVLIALLRLVQLSGQHALGLIDSPATAIEFGPITLLATTLISLLQSFLSFCYWLIIASIILSWVMVLTQSRSPYIGVVMQLTEPILAPIRRVMPDLGPLDLSPMVAFLAIIICQRLLDYATVALMGML